MREGPAGLQAATTARSAGLRPASRGSAKPAPITLRQAKGGPAQPALHIESIELRNYRVFRRAELRELPGLAVVVGANGSGKSTLFDVLGFLKEALTENVAAAVARRGGFRNLVSRDEPGPIRIKIGFTDDGRRTTYVVEFRAEHDQVVVQRERVRSRNGGNGSERGLLDFRCGTGWAVRDETGSPNDYGPPDRARYALEDPSALAIKGLGQFRAYRVVSEIRRAIEAWCLPDAIPTEDSVGPSHLPDLAVPADRVAAAARRRLERTTSLGGLEAKRTEDGRFVFRWGDRSFRDPFTSPHISSGALRMFACRVLLHDPEPGSLLALAQPEEGLGPDLLPELAEAFSEYERRGGQALLATYSPGFLDSMNLGQIYFLAKEDGFTTVRRAAESETLRNLVAEGDLPETLWKQGLLEGSPP